MFSFAAKTHGTWRSGYPGQKQGKNITYFKTMPVAGLEIEVAKNSCMVKKYFSRLTKFF